VLENVFEGFIGALFEDQQIFLYNGLQRCNGFISTTLSSAFKNIQDIRRDDNYKDTVLRLYDKNVFELIQFTCESNHEERLHTVSLKCIYNPVRIQYIIENGYQVQDLASIMNSIPNLQVYTKNIQRTGKNKRETEQETSKILMEFLGIRMVKI
jgi:hypothetical protein